MKNNNQSPQTKPLNELVGNVADNSRRVSHIKSVKDKTADTLKTSKGFKNDNL